MTTVPGRYDGTDSAGADDVGPVTARRMWEALPHWVHSGTATLVARDWLILPAVAALLAIVTARTSLASELLIDGRLFTTAGCQVLSGHVSAAYSNSALQSGPLQNSIYCLTSKVTAHGRPTAWFACAAAAAVSVMRIALRTVQRRAGLAPSRAAITVVAAYFTFWGVPTLLSVHLAEVLIPVMWVGGALLVRRHPLWAGVLLGASVGVELWGLVAIPIVLAASTSRRRLGSAVVAGFVASALVLPFAAAGHLAMFQFQWPVMPHTLPALIWQEPKGGPPFVFGVVPRIAQLGFALTGCALAAYRVRDDPRLLPWLPAMSAELLRLLVDPTLYTYYWIAPEILAAVALVCANSTRERLALAVVAVLQVAGELNEYRVAVVTLSLLLIGSSLFGRAPSSSSVDLWVRRFSPSFPEGVYRRDETIRGSTGEVSDSVAACTSLSWYSAVLSSISSPVRPPHRPRPPARSRDT